jgi:hypothetical protein
MWERKWLVVRGNLPIGPRLDQRREDGFGGGKKPWKYEEIEVGEKVRRDAVWAMKRGKEPIDRRRMRREEKIECCDEGGNLRARRNKKERMNG